MLQFIVQFCHFLRWSSEPPGGRFGVLPCRGKCGLICPGSQRWTPSPKGLTASLGPWLPPSPCRVSAPVHQAKMAGWIIPGLEGVIEAGSCKILAVEPSRVHIKGPSKTKTQDNIPQGGWSCHLPRGLCGLRLQWPWAEIMSGNLRQARSPAAPSRGSVCVLPDASHTGNSWASA